jgi:L-amino acid N-acyltransferase YncA
MKIRPAGTGDLDAMWRIFQAVVATGTTYVFAPDTCRDEGLGHFTGPGVTSWVAENERGVVGMYRLVPNHRDLGSHVANAAFMVDPAHAGRGVGKEMGLHCLREARRSGFLAVQFNFVVSTNTAAVTLWERLGFRTVGTLPQAFRHSELGLVDAYVLHRFLNDVSLDPCSGTDASEPQTIQSAPRGNATASGAVQPR